MCTATLPETKPFEGISEKAHQNYLAFERRFPPRRFDGVSMFVALVRSLIGQKHWLSMLNTYKLAPLFWVRMNSGMHYSDFDALLAQCVELGVLRKQTLSLTLEGVEPSPIEVVCVGIGNQE